MSIAFNKTYIDNKTGESVQVCNELVINDDTHNNMIMYMNNNSRIFVSDMKKFHSHYTLQEKNSNRQLLKMVEENLVADQKYDLATKVLDLMGEIKTNGSYKDDEYVSIKEERTQKIRELFLQCITQEDIDQAFSNLAKWDGEDETSCYSYTNKVAILRTAMGVIDSFDDIELCYEKDYDIECEIFLDGTWRNFK